MKKIILGLVLIALFVLASAQEVESDLKIWDKIKEKTKKIDWNKVDKWVDKGYAIYKVIKGITDDDEVQADAEFPWVPVAVFVGRSLATGAAGAAAKHAWDKFRGRDATEAELSISPKYAPCLKCFNLRFPSLNVTKQCWNACRNSTKQIKDDVESDIAWVPVAVFAGRALAGGALSAAGKHAYDKFIRRKDFEQMSEAEIWGTIGKFIAEQGVKQAGKWAYNKIFRRDEIESDFSLACTAECTMYYTCKIKGSDASVCVYPKGCECNKFAWQKDEVEADKALTAVVKPTCRRKCNPKQFPKVEERKACFAECKNNTKTEKPKRASKKVKVPEVESEKIDWKKIFSPENIQKAVEIYKIIRSKDNVVESDAEAEFFKKLGGLVKKVAPIAKKGFDIYKKAKGFGILAETADAGQVAANYARQQVGKCYSQDVNKRRGPSCFDCSGLVNKAWEVAGKKVPWTTHGYPDASVVKVSSSSLRPGDICWRSGHVAMYVGNGETVEAANSKVGVVKRSFNASQWTAFYRPK